MDKREKKKKWARGEIGGGERVADVERERERKGGGGGKRGGGGGVHDSWAYDKL